MTRTRTLSGSHTVDKKIHLFRHSQAVHNIRDDFDLADPRLTPFGESQSKEIAVNHARVIESEPQLIVTSPLVRTIQTTLLGFKGLLDQNVPLVIHPDLQECSAAPCDTGSERQLLETMFPDLDFSLLTEDWTSKTGQYAADEATLKMRARNVRQWLKDRPENNIIVVSHGSFIRHLTNAPWRDRWQNAEGRSYHIVDNRDCTLKLAKAVGAKKVQCQ